MHFWESWGFCIGWAHSAHGITGSVQEWIKSWLKDRTQWVEIQGAKSRPGKVRSGVPQGSILGPVLFVIYINDLDDDIIIDILRKFADDTKQANKIRNQADADSFQISLNKLLDWSKTWGMLFNIDKCKILHCGRNNPKNEYYMDNIKLGTVESERDIGIRITSNLKPSSHCNEIVNKAKAVLNQISRSFHYRDKHVFIRLYKQYVRPHLEFSSSVWNPWNLADIKNIEAVQIKAVKMVSGLKSQDYHERLKEL
jgi:ribonuclease P/MRP protein subunit RPP40